MSDRCKSCHRKSHAASRASSSSICHRTGSHECNAATVGYQRAERDVSVHVAALVRDLATDEHDQVIDSAGVPSIAAAMRHLAERGRVKIEAEDGANVTGRWA